MIELANGFDRLLQLLIIVQPSTNLGDTLTPNAELLRSPAGIGYRQNKYSVPLAARAFRAILAVTDRAVQKRAAQQFAANR